MPTFKVFEAQEEVRCRKWLHFIDAADEQEAVEKVISEDWTSDPIDCGELGEPDYMDSGYVARVEGSDEDSVWEDAVSDLATRKMNQSPAYYMQNALTEILALAQKGIDDRSLSLIKAHCRDALGRAWGVPADKVVARSC